MIRFALKWGAHSIAWSLSVALVLTPYAFAQEDPALGDASGPSGAQEFLLAQEDVPAEAPSESSAESAVPSDPEPAPDSPLAEAETATEPITPAAAETPAEGGEPPASADQALQQDSTPSLVSPEQVGGDPAAAQTSTAPAEAAGEGKAPSALSKVPWWVWALSAAAVVVLAGALSGGGGGGGGGGNDKKDGESDSGTVGYTW